MALGLRDLDDDFQRKVAGFENRIRDLERVASGRNSIGVDKLMPVVKAGTPVDGDFLRAPPIGTPVTDTAASKLWLRTAAGTWKFTALT